MVAHLLISLTVRPFIPEGLWEVKSKSTREYIAEYLALKQIDRVAS
jgi:hypothetical protein